MPSAVALVVAAAAGKAGVIDALLEAAGDSASTLANTLAGAEPTSALVAAAAAGKFETVKRLLAAGADRTAVGKDGLDAAAAAGKAGHSHIVAALNQQKTIGKASRGRCIGQSAPHTRPATYRGPQLRAEGRGCSADRQCRRRPGEAGGVKSNGQKLSKLRNQSVLLNSRGNTGRAGYNYFRSSLSLLMMCASFVRLRVPEFQLSIFNS